MAERHSLPPVLAVAGTDAHRSRQYVRSVTGPFAARGGTVWPLDGGDTEGLQQLLGSVGVLYSADTLVVVTAPEKLPPAPLLLHLQEGTPGLTFLLLYTTDSPAGELAARLPRECTRVYSLPPTYKMDEYAAAYAVEAARARGCHLTAALALSLVRRVGSDLGGVHYEIDKAVQCARARGQVELTPELVRDTLAPLGEMDGSRVGEALALRQARPLAEELHRYYQSKRGDPTVELCGRVLSPLVLRWLQAAHLAAAGLSPKVAAGRVGANAWYWEHKVVPAARVWGRDGCAQVLRVIASAQEAVFAGAVSPWRGLSAGLLGATLPVAPQ